MAEPTDSEILEQLINVLFDSDLGQLVADLGLGPPSDRPARTEIERLLDGLGRAVIDPARELSQATRLLEGIPNSATSSVDPDRPDADSLGLPVDDTEAVRLDPASISEQLETLGELESSIHELKGLIRADQD